MATKKKKTKKPKNQYKLLVALSRSDQALLEYIFEKSKQTRANVIVRALHLWAHKEFDFDKGEFLRFVKSDFLPKMEKDERATIQKDLKHFAEYFESGDALSDLGDTVGELNPAEAFR